MSSKPPNALIALEALLSGLTVKLGRDEYHLFKQGDKVKIGYNEDAWTVDTPYHLTKLAMKADGAKAHFSQSLLLSHFLRLADELPAEAIPQLQARTETPSSILRLIPVARATGHKEQYLCSDQYGVPRLSDPGQGFTILAGEPAHMSKTPIAVFGNTPAAAWSKWYKTVEIPVDVQDDGGVPGDTVLRLSQAEKHLSTLQQNGWSSWLHDEEQDVAIMFRSEFALPCTCWPSRQPDQNRECGLHCTFRALIERINEARK